VTWSNKYAATSSPRRRRVIVLAAEFMVKSLAAGEDGKPPVKPVGFARSFSFY
jgi:hypothetical protein